MRVNPVYNLKEWIENNKDMLKPPVGNKFVNEDLDVIVMAVGGPNARISLMNKNFLIACH